MKKITLAIVALGLIVGLNSCKESTKEQVNDITDDMSYDDDGGDDDGGHSHDDGDHDHGDTLMIGKEVIVAMGSKSGSDVTGKIILTQGEKEVNMVVSLTGLTAGEHAIHIHENGDCSSDDGKSAGGHWNPTTEDHGKWGDHDHHMGDIGNLIANDEGGATLTFNTDKWCIGCDDDTRNVLGKAFIVHATADDFESQPSGAAGARVACGVIE
ncbi:MULTISPECIES: superoxide dismutase family protein [Nonlabens]|uniref:superoxide dismutase family protein n=1 Tax=Nonlabens TaxID=363408 RepID=UPI0029433168|nr:superoxide dismutase family protein [Nonlabens ulvanivorans]WOI23361.1 superoxide dismutase family protein [Nonlabens ulvanivorans]|tara:strand:+ start:160 stop:795 length:636 start_codon:yes stop_codon:yes gene_type:complete